MFPDIVEEQVELKHDIQLLTFFLITIPFRNLQNLRTFTQLMSRSATGAFFTFTQFINFLHFPYVIIQ